MNEFGLFAQDSWRVTPTLTLNARRALGGAAALHAAQRRLLRRRRSPISAASRAWATGPGGRACNMFKPGSARGGRASAVHAVRRERRTVYGTDWNNFAPNVGVAWRPNVQGGWLRTLLGDPEQATLRGGYSVSFTRNRMDEFTGVYGGQPGQHVQRQPQRRNRILVLPGETWPVLLPRQAPARSARRISPAGAPSYPLASTSPTRSTSSIPTRRSATCSPTPSASSARSRSDTAIEVRYVGNRACNDWIDGELERDQHLRERVPDEFKLAQANLRANVAAARPRQLVRLLRARARARRRCRSISRYFNGSAAAQATRSGPLHGDELDEQHAPGRALGCSTRCRTSAAATSAATARRPDVPAERASRRACRRTSS